MKLLLIESDSKLAATYVAAFKSSSIQAVHANSAQSAVHTIDREIPDVIVLELQLPGHNGIEFLHELRSYAEWQSIPVVLLTMVPPTSLQITHAQLRQYGVVDVLYKPATSLTQLQNSVNEASSV